MKYPCLTESEVISFDIETFDPELRKKGTGVFSDNGRILGVAIADEKGFQEYYNVGHRGINQEEKTKNLNYLREVLAIPNKKLGTNILYDLDWLCNSHNMQVNGQLYDIQIAEPLLDEYRVSYSLDNLAKDYLKKEKFKTEIEEFCAQNKLAGDPRRHLYLMPYKLVRKYAIQDVVLPIKIFKRQWKKLHKEDLLDLFHLEMDLFPLLLQMRKTGVRMNTQLLEDSKKIIKDEITVLQNNLKNKYGDFNYNSSPQIADVFDRLKIPYGYTEKGSPSFEKKFLASCEHEIAKDILEVKHKEKIYSTFLVNSFTEHQVDGRIHCSFFPMRTEGYGTKSGRFSSANPNLQQIPSDSDDEVSRLCRQLFIPEEDHYWGKIDYSQIEYRLIAHYATGKKAGEVREQYNKDPKTDYHQLIMDWTGVNRKDAKRLNFGMAYAMGVQTCSEMFGWGRTEAEDLITRYNEMVPFVRYSRNQVSNVARGRGYIKTILGRRARLNEQMLKDGKEYTMFNRLIQGSAADMMKKAMVDSYKAGIFNVLKPHLTVHDELDVSVPKTKDGVQAFIEMKYIMEKAIKLQVPVIADAELGNNWANCTEENFYSIKKGWNL